MATHFNDWLTTEQEKEIRAWSRDLGLFNIEVDVLLDPVYPRLITLKQTKLTEAQVKARITKLAEIKAREGHQNMALLSKEQQEGIRQEAAEADPVGEIKLGVQSPPDHPMIFNHKNQTRPISDFFDGKKSDVSPEETPAAPAEGFGIGVEIVYKGQPLKMPGNNMGLSVMPSTKGIIRDKAANGWMVEFYGFVGEISVPEVDLNRADAPAPKAEKLDIDDLVKVELKGEGFVVGLSAGKVQVAYGKGDGPSWEPRSLVHLVKTRHQLHQEQLEALQEQIKTLLTEKAAEIDRARMYQQRAENAEQKANHAPLPSIGEVDALRQQNDTLGREVTLLRTQLAGASLVAPDEQNPGIQTRTIIQDMQTPERQAAAEREYNALRRAGWDVVHIQFSADLKSRAVMLELDTTPASPFDDAINEALSRLEEDEQEAPAGNPAPAIEGVIIGLDDDEDDELEDTFQLKDIKSSKLLRQLWNKGIITADEYKEHSRRIVREVGLASLRASSAERKPFHPFRVPVIEAVQS